MTRILFQGDSITDAGRARGNDQALGALGYGYPLYVRARLNTDHPGAYDVINRGVSGDRIVDVYARIRRDIINLKPDVLSVLIGINDVWHSLSDDPNGVEAPKFERVYDMLLCEVREALPDCRFIILEPFVLEAAATVPDESCPDRWHIFDREVPLRAQAARRVAEKHGATFVPLQRVFDEACKKAEPSWWLQDGVHPTAAGHELITREWLKAFETLST